mmetsp:Transcript_48390/g.121997  ORF Transcript_48390/g.121997 Transcript_48390/m.121997 type:complete len:575 (+) Transcript_48390:46-1770(+)|eukprot:CAMPEP_0115390814 /NCGR_PEP_ID=MMETSP0271-20121206/10392_1 /TAXON_ID=71861 /ORGANISM="Scrippsiella trochoidea, Strain CCMP3099" /LENGTH=574 /DNA_ID=CAMNT_0002814361 /DNA_START=46 /DNA_END=1770 /DNA_ORIENTATION=-
MFLKGWFARLLAYGAMIALPSISAEESFQSRFFLTKAEVHAPRFAVPRTGLSLVSTNNHVRYLPNGDRFMSRLHEVLNSTVEGDFIYASFWEINAQVILKPVRGKSEAAQRADNATRLINVLAAASARNVTIRILVSSGIMQTLMHLRAQCDLINSRCGPETCVMDNRHGHTSTGSSHEKMWMVRRGQNLIVFTGSMDVASVRWDTARHNINSSRWQKQPSDPVRHFAWHGTMYEIQGGAAEDIYQTFLDRWNDPVAPKGGALVPLPRWQPVDERNFSGYTGSLPCQVVRTFSCQGARKLGIYQQFAPYGEFTYAALWFKALRAARKYIFVADQFMFYDEAMEAVAEAAEHVDFVILVTDPQIAYITLPTGRKVRSTIYSDALQYYQYGAVFGALETRDPTGKLAQKVHMFSLVKEGLEADHPANQIYDHEKTLIIDDEFALVGSTGVERVGFTNDAELSVGIESGEFVSGLRRKIFAEFLQISPRHPVLQCPYSAHKEWMRQADANIHRVRHYKPIQNISAAEHMVAKEIYEFIEPDGRCKDGAFKYQWQAARDAGTDRVQEDLDAMQGTMTI